MFEKLLKELEQLKKTQNVSVPIDADKDGYIDKECPNNECLFEFKVNKEDWESLLRQENIFCPRCRHEANADSWYTTKQLEEGKRQVKQYMISRINKALRQSAIEFNAKQSRSSFIKLTMSISPDRSHHYIVPIASKDEMLLKIKCKECNVRYAFIGSAFFCPYCGHNSADETFDNSIIKIENKLKNLHIIREAVAEISKDEAETTCRSLIETSLNECVVAFQRFCEVTFLKKSPQSKLKFNAFQNLDIGGKYWKDLLNEGYLDWLTKTEFSDLNKLFQKRHLLSHTEGIVDQKYIDRSNDLIYKVGQRIVIKETDVRKLLEIINKVVYILRKI